MTPQPSPNSPQDGLQFQKAEFQDARPKCVVCHAIVESEYYQLAGQTACPACAEKARIHQEGPSGPSVMRAALYGLGAAAACSIGYSIITMVTGMEIALISILVGYLIGRAVRHGARGVGGRRCQILAVALTYSAITTAYVPLIIKAFVQSSKKAAAISGAPARTNTVPQDHQPRPVRIGGVQRAWHLNARDERLLMGPYKLNEEAAGA